MAGSGVDSRPTKKKRPKMNWVRSVSSMFSKDSQRKDKASAVSSIMFGMSIDSAHIRPPWESDDGGVVWPRSRILLYRVLSSANFEMFMAFVIIFNVYLIVWDADELAKCYPLYHKTLEQCTFAAPSWVATVGAVLLAVYTVEAGARVYVEWEHFKDSSRNFLDVFIVGAGWLDQLAGTFVNVAFLRFFRVLRLVRVLRVFIVFRELYMMLVGVVSAMRTIVWGALMLFTMLLLWGIILVELVHPTNSSINYGDCERCPRGFGSVMSAVLTLFQTIVAGDSWGTIAVPLIEEAPWTALLLVCSLLMISLGLMNLILAVIVERAADAREKDMEERVKQKDKAQHEQKEKLFVLCEEMDQDGSGQLNMNELMLAYDSQIDFRNTLNMLDIHKDEIQSLVKVLDQDGSGEIDYKEFCEQLYSIKTRDTRTMLTFIKLAISECNDTVERRHEELLQMLGGRHQMQDHMLAAMNDTLRTLSLGVPSNGSAAGAHHGKRPGPPRAPPQPTTDVPPVLSRTGVLKELQLLGSRSQKLATLETQLLQRMDDQASKLSGQVSTLSELTVYLEQAAGAVEDLDQSEWPKIDEKLSRLRVGMQQELQALVDDIDQRLEESTMAVARNTELMTSLAGDLGCRVAVQDLPRNCSTKGAFRKPTAVVEPIMVPAVGPRRLGGSQRLKSTSPRTPMEMCGCADARRKPLDVPLPTSPRSTGARP